MVMKMIKFFKKLGKMLYVIIESFLKFIDKIIIMPISRLVYNISKSTSGNNVNFNKLLNRPQFLIILSLIFAVICFFIIDHKVISLVSTEAGVIKNVPVNLIYNEGVFVVENVPKTINITITGNKEDIYLAKQLGEFSVDLDLSKYTKPGTYKVAFTYSKNLGSVDYILNPSYLTVTIKDLVSDRKTVTYDLVGTDNLDKKLSVSSVTLDSNEVVVKGSQDAIDRISSIKALIDLSNKDFTDAGTYTLSNIPLVAYDKDGEIIKNVEIVEGTLTGNLVLSSYMKSVPISVSTTGSLVSGKAIASILINNKASYSVNIYGDEEEIKDINSVPVTINVDGLGSESVKNYTVVIVKPKGVRYVSDKNASISVTFGDEEQKTVEVSSINHKYLADGYSATIISQGRTEVQVKGVQSNINAIEAGNIKAYVDLSGLGEGTHEVPVKIENTNPLVSYAVTRTIQIRITKN